jgi:hypothetical protein
MKATLLDMIHHLDATYDRLVPGEIEVNCLVPSTLWNQDRPIKDLWASVENFCCIAKDGNPPITR